MLFYESIFEEALKKVKVSRKGKPVWVWRTTDPKKKVLVKDGRPREVPKKASEVRKRKVGAKKAVRKLKPKRKQIAKKRSLSVRRRSW